MLCHTGPDACILVVHQSAGLYTEAGLLPFAASLARKVYMRQNIGVGEFARQYGGRNKRKGAVPEHFAKASRGLIRHILKQV